MADMSIFNEDEFTLTSLTTLANETPPIPGQIGATLDFEEDSITTTSIKVEREGATLALVEPTPRGGPGEVIDHDKRGMRTFDATHLQRDESVKAEEVQNVRASGSATEAMQLQDLVDSKMRRHYRDFDLTDEWMKVGVISGKIVSGKGHTILDIYGEFGLAVPAPIELDLSNEATKVRLFADELRTDMEDDLVAPSYESVVAFCGNGFFRDLVDFKEVRETYLNTAAAFELRGILPDVVNYGGVTWVRHKTGSKARAAAGGNLIADDEARVCFKGVPGLYITRFAPADYWDTVNRPGLPRYMNEAESQRTEKAAFFEVQTNPIHLCTQPATLRRLKLKAA
ncbi:MAG: hypothetical protein H6R00_179 [Proteobacteria bacterium]|nr:hypothetical protein [Pseudomonadota bacterium]